MRFIKFLSMLLVVGLLYGCAGKDIQKITEVTDNVAKAAQEVVVINNKIKDISERTKESIEDIGALRTYLVKPGDTLWDVSSDLYSCKLVPANEGGYLWPLLCDLNNLGNCDLIPVGQVLLYRAPKYLEGKDLQRYFERAFSEPDK